MKAILVIDMPRDCEECPLYDEYQMRCYYLRNDKYAVDVIPSWCPLKPLPQKEEKPKVSGGLDWDNAFNCGYVVGWNACLEEIEE